MLACLGGMRLKAPVAIARGYVSFAAFFFSFRCLPDTGGDHPFCPSLTTQLKVDMEPLWPQTPIGRLKHFQRQHKVQSIYNSCRLDILSAYLNNECPALLLAPPPFSFLIHVTHLSCSLAVWKRDRGGCIREER